MYQVIARKYRPQTFSELIGQEHVRMTLSNAIAQGRIAHGYIFSGQRGTGKTTVARVLARCLNCDEGPTAEPCLKCSSCREIAESSAVDVIEIDAASNRGINEMRELRENVRYRPARSRYKVFIIDEAHQITSEAFNALLKTLEEPPEWVIFVLCTTEAHKIPTTIASRCQQFSFRSVEHGELVERMKWICERENITAAGDVLDVLAQVGEGSVRDSLSALDQAIACCGGTLVAEDVRELLGLFSLDTMKEVTRALEDGDSRRMLEIVEELERNGRNLQHFCRELARYFRNLLVVRLVGADSRLVAASAEEQRRLAEVAARFSEEDLTRFLQLTLDLYRDLQYSLQPRLHLEIGLLRLIHAGRLVALEEALARIGVGDAPAAPKLGGGSTPAPSTPPRTGTPAPPRPAPPSAAPPATGLHGRLLEALREGGQTFLADAVEAATVEETPSELRFQAPKEFTLSFRSAELKKAVERVAGRPLRIVFTAVASEAPPAVARPSAAPAAEPGAQARAMEHPEVRRFQEVFSGSQVRAVRDLRG